jgi:hypothetical protein
MARIFTKKNPVTMLVIRSLPLLIHAVPAGITSVADCHMNAKSKICRNYPGAAWLTGNPAPVMRRLS